MPSPLRNPVSRRLQALARMFCYALGPLSAALILRFRQFGNVWSIRFHAFHSVLLTAAWALVWSALRGAEKILPWFLSVVVRELRLAVNLSFVLMWVLLVATAYEGRRFAAVPLIHRLAVRLARRTEGP